MYSMKQQRRNYLTILYVCAMRMYSWIVTFLTGTITTRSDWPESDGWLRLHEVTIKIADGSTQHFKPHLLFLNSDSEVLRSRIQKTKSIKELEKIAK